MFHDIRPLKYWCQKVIPLVYDESLSYYELLCKVVHKLNEVIVDVNNLPEMVDEAVEERLTDEHLKELIDELIVLYKHIITPNDDGSNVTASRSWDMGTWIWLNDVLYITCKEITEGNAYVFTGENANVKTITIDDIVTNTYYSEQKKLSIHGNIRA